MTVRWRGPRVLGVAAAALLALIALVLLAPAAPALERADEISAPPATVYEILIDPRMERRWSPWRDAHAHYLFSGPAFGTGAAVEWSGATRGNAEIAAATPYDDVEQTLSLGGQPRRNSFRLTRSAQGAHIVWSVTRDRSLNPLAAWSALLFPKAAAAEQARGLDRLGDLAEALPHADMQAFGVRVAPSPARPFAYVEGETAESPEAVARALGTSADAVAAALRRARLTPVGGPVWSAWAAQAQGRLRYRGGFALAGGASPDGPALSAAGGVGARVKLGTLGGVDAVEAEHRGGLDELPQAEAAIRLFQSIHQLSPAGPGVVSFSADPRRPPPEGLAVRVSVPVAGG